MKKNKFLVVVPVYNSEKWIGKCLESILTQTYKNYTLVVVDDCSTDNTPKIIKSIWDKYGQSFKSVRNKKRTHSPVGNFVKDIELCPGNKEDIIVTVDGDDWLYSNDVLEYMNGVYVNRSVWLTYGSFTSVSKTMENYCKPFGLVWRYRRWGSWCTSHLRTLKRKVFDEINKDDLKDMTTGEYYTQYGDACYMYPAIEISGHRHIKFVEKILYVYNDLNSLCQIDDINTIGDVHREMRQEIKKRPQYQRIVTL